MDGIFRVTAVREQLEIPSKSVPGEISLKTFLEHAHLCVEKHPHRDVTWSLRELYSRVSVLTGGNGPLFRPSVRRKAAES